VILRAVVALLIKPTAIGYSTNMIASDSNLIIVRGGKHPVDSQLKRAAVRFFGESEVNEKAQTQSMERTRTRDSQSLYRVTTGASSIAGEGNGSRPGGFVLVIDGAALDDVSEANRHSIPC
jgi:phospholipid-translocating ATPase